MDLYDELTQRNERIAHDGPAQILELKAADRDRRVRRSKDPRNTVGKICRCNFCERHTAKIGHRR